jgi:hypothetical protein
MSLPLLLNAAFHAIGLNARGEIVLRKKFSRKQLLVFTANRQQMLIGTGAYGGAPTSLVPCGDKAMTSGSCPHRT